MKKYIIGSAVCALLQEHSHHAAAMTISTRSQYSSRNQTCSTHIPTYKFDKWVKKNYSTSTT